MYNHSQMVPAMFSVSTIFANFSRNLNTLHLEAQDLKCQKSINISNKQDVSSTTFKFYMSKTFLQKFEGINHK